MNLIGEQRLHCGRSPAYEDQLKIQPLALVEAFFLRHHHREYLNASDGNAPRTDWLSTRSTPTKKQAIEITKNNHIQSALSEAVEACRESPMSFKHTPGHLSSNRFIRSTTSGGCAMTSRASVSSSSPATGSISNFRSLA